ncbi:hypothetical protein M9H77_35651 [Catharanthus roseus]|uniref:Uncharacterized protein n=1 Tax=Catharanthus roseus TaxID=4058 RepID=A0ACB9ZS63_CATRO|nr:hypothetical protein M9H77_35651 [Catharanthus roseus]
MTLPELLGLLQLLLRKSCSLSMTVTINSYFVVVSPVLGSLSKSKHISATSTPECEETCNSTIGLDGQGPDPKTRSSKTSPASRSQYSPTPYERSITKQPLSPNLVKTSGYKLLGHLPGLSWDKPRCRVPLDSSLGG